MHIGSNGCRRPRVLHIAGRIMVRFCVVAVAGAHLLHVVLRRTNIFQCPDGILQVIRWPSPELHRHDVLPPPLNRCGLLRIPTSRGPRVFRFALSTHVYQVLRDVELNPVESTAR
jgi:hypothetical protein